MEQIKVSAEVREVGKKSVNRRLRRTGLIPAVLYGKGQTPMGLQVNSKEFVTLMSGAAGINALMNLEVNNSGKKEHIVAMLKEFQTDVLTRKITHLDLLKIDMTKKVSVKIPIVLTGKAIGLTKGGLIEQNRRELEVRCLPGNIPDSIELDITHLDLGHSLHVNEIKLPENVELPSDSDFALVSIVAPREEEPAAVTAAPSEVPATQQTAEAGAAAPGEAKEKEEKKK